MEGSFFSSLIITLREGAEGAVAIAIVLLYLRKTGRSHLRPAVWWGLATAILGSFVCAYLLQVYTVNNELVEGILMFVAAFFVTTMIVWMWRSAKGLKKEIESKIDEIAGRQESGISGPWLGLFFFTLFMILREGIETVIFLGAVSLTTQALWNFIGGLLGLAVAVVFGVFLVRGSVRLDLGRFFKITGIVLLLFVVQLLMGAVHELGEGGFIDIGPRGMSIIGPIVKNNALFLIGVLLIPALMLLIPSRKTKQQAEGQSRAEQRLLIAQEKRQRMWKVGAALLSVGIVLFMAYDLVYGQNRKLSPPVPVTAQDGMVRIPLEQVSDGVLHRFVLDGTPIRFIMMRIEPGRVVVVFDACEICGSQGYVQESNALICLNCDADINTSTLEQGGGCNPIPLASHEEAGSLVISVENLKEKEAIFHTGSEHH